MEKWVISAKRADFQEIGRKFHIDPVTARLIRNRDVEGDAAIREYLHGDLRQLHDPALMKDMERAAELLDGLSGTMTLTESCPPTYCCRGCGIWEPGWTPGFRSESGTATDSTCI